jgi:hypothetical protein
MDLSLKSTGECFLQNGLAEAEGHSPAFDFQDATEADGLHGERTQAEPQRLEVKSRQNGNGPATERPPCPS